MVGTSGHSVRRKSLFQLKESIIMDDTGFGGLKLDIDTTNGEIKATYHVLMEVKNKKSNRNCKRRIFHSLKFEILNLFAIKNSTKKYFL